MKTLGLASETCQPMYTLSQEMVCEGIVNGVDIVDNGGTLEIGAGLVLVKVTDTVSGVDYFVKVYLDGTDTLTNQANADIVLKIPTDNVQDGSLNTDLETIAILDIGPTGSFAGYEFFIVIGTTDGGSAVTQDEDVYAGVKIGDCDCIKCGPNGLHFGDVEIENLIVNGTTNLGNTEIDGDLIVTGIITGNIDVSSLVLGNLKKCGFEAGANLSGATTPQAVYIGTDGLVYPTDPSDCDNASRFIGFVDDDYLLGDTDVCIIADGILCGFTGLEPGEDYFLNFNVVDTTPQESAGLAGATAAALGTTTSPTLGQEIETPSGLSSELTSISVRLKKNGSPGDYLEMKVYDSVGGNLLYTSDNIVLGASLTTSFSTENFTFTGATLVPGVVYFYRLVRSTASDNSNYYTVGYYNNSDPYTPGSMWTNNGTSWSDTVTDDISFEANFDNEEYGTDLGTLQTFPYPGCSIRIGMAVSDECIHICCGSNESPEYLSFDLDDTQNIFGEVLGSDLPESIAVQAGQSITTHNIVCPANGYFNVYCEAFYSSGVNPGTTTSTLYINGVSYGIIKTNTNTTSFLPGVIRGVPLSAGDVLTVVTSVASSYSTSGKSRNFVLSGNKIV